MTNAPRDNNRVETLLGISNADGLTPTPVFTLNPSNHTVQISDGTTGSDLSGESKPRDDNGNTVVMGVSSSDGITPILIYVNPSTGELLIDSS
jgi:hypothetical protein